jgi:di/tricarboxylate transporter
MADQTPGKIGATLAACAAFAATAVLLAALPQPARAWVLVAAAILLWATGWLPDHVTALAFFALALIAGVAPAEVVFSGFHSTALWLIIGGLVIGLAVREAGLADRMAAYLIARTGPGYGSAIATVTLLGIALIFVMPSSMGRVVMLMPIAAAYAARCGFGAGSRGRTGILLAAALGTYLPSAAVLPANLPNIVLAAGAEQLHGIRVNYADYLMLLFPVLGAAKAVLVAALIAWRFREPGKTIAQEAPSGPWSTKEVAVASVLAISFLLWLTDFMHGISPGWIALAGAVVCLVPRAGLLNAQAFNRDMSFTAIFHAAGIIGLGAVVASSGMGETLGKAFAQVLPFTPGAGFVNFWLLGLLSTVTCLVTTTTGVPAVLTPLAPGLAAGSGLPLEVVLLSQAVGFSTLLFPYQGAPLVFALHYAGVAPRAAIGLLLAIGAVSLLVLAPLTWLWWGVLGRAG